MALVVALCLLLVLSLSRPQNALQSEQETNAHAGLAAPPAPSSPNIRELLSKEDASHLSAKQTYAHVPKDNAKAGLFVLAALGTIVLMAAVYCVYNKFYTKHQYLHAQLHDDAELTLDSTVSPPIFLRSSVSSMGSVDGGVRQGGYGSLSDTPSVISVPPLSPMSPPPTVVPFPPIFLSSQSLSTISARDLEKSFI